MPIWASHSQGNGTKQAAELPLHEVLDAQAVAVEVGAVGLPLKQRQTKSSAPFSLSTKGQDATQHEKSDVFFALSHYYTLKKSLSLPRGTL